jgi:putative ABC transport system substrate-binding protein
MTGAPADRPPPIRYAARRPCLLGDPMQFDHLRRREFITLLGGAAAAWPLASRAQVPRIGFLGAGSPSSYATQLEAFRLGLRDLGYVEGTNLIIEYRWAQGKYERLRELAAELVRSNVDVVVTHGTPGALAAKQATAAIPIVVILIGDPVAAGIVPSLARPGGNVTGQSFFSPELAAKRIELLKDSVPQMTRVAVLLNPGNPVVMGAELKAMETASQSLKVEIQQVLVRDPNELERAFERMQQGSVAAVAISEDSMLIANIRAIAAAATKWRFVSIGNKEFAQAGGLMGYGVDYFTTYRRSAVFVDRILKGAKPADIPIEQATKFHFVMNLKTAKALGIDIPTSLLVRADEVIE